MRYYKLSLYTNSAQIEENAVIRLKDYAYDSPIGSLNAYMIRHKENSVFFFAYREEGKVTFASFAYDERANSFQNAFDSVMGILRETFKIKKLKDYPSEITMYQYYEHYDESRRRDYVTSWRAVERSNYCNWFYEQFRNPNGEDFTYQFREAIIPEESAERHEIYDAGFLRELSNIEAHKNTPEVKGNMVHYIISGRSMETACDMTEALMRELFRANRISSRRMEIISEIRPEVYRGNSHIEEIIENNAGGVIVIDLTERFGKNPTDYLTAAEYIGKVFKQYRNQCLFVFTYNMDHPGFSYYLLPEIRKYAILITLKEGRGNRKTAVRYLESLIEASEYAEYASQAEEYMELFPGEEFTQTDILMAYERFESWCVNKNILHAYEYDLSEEFLLERDSNQESCYDKLQNLIGLDKVKKQIDTIIAADIVEAERKKRLGRDYQSGTMHMVFAGNPGTAKTTVAELFAGIAKEKGILKSGAFVVRGGMDLDGVFCVNEIREAFQAARGGVLFIDEAYSLKSDIATTALIQELESQRDQVIVVLAGYNDRMRQFMEQNEGLRSRIPHWIDFPDYSADEQTEIFRSMARERGFRVTDEAVKEAHFICERLRLVENFGNGRYVRNMLDRAVQNQAVRLLSNGLDPAEIDKRKLFQLIKEDISALEEGSNELRLPGTARKELNDLIGLSSAKEILNKVIASHKLNKLCSEKGIARERSSLHMVFTGNPGTAKTTVARLFAEVLRDEKILSTGNFVELGRADLIGRFVGHTAPMVRKRFREAQGGVLFIDEAYSLCDNQENGYGNEAISTIVQEMENHRENVIVIFAGYPDQMEEFLDRNPGMRSRIAFYVEFDDYSTEELCDITRFMAHKKGLKLTDAAMSKLRAIYDTARKQKGYGNGRFVRKMLEEAEMNLAERVMRSEDADFSTESITTLDECDIPEFSLHDTDRAGRRRIGFAC